MFDDEKLAGITKLKPRWVWALFLVVLFLLAAPLVMTVFALF